MDLAFQTLAVVLVLGGLAFCARLLRRQGAFLPRNSASALVTSGRIQLTPQHGLHIVKFGDRELLVATHPSGCAVLDSSPAARQGAAQ